MSSSPAAASKPDVNKDTEKAPPAAIMEALEEDDEFEEFEPEHWSKTETEDENQQWMDNWDDDMDDDFTKTLREELQKQSK